MAFYFSGVHRINLTTATNQYNMLTKPWYQNCDLLKLNAVMALRSWTQVSLLTFLPVLVATKGVSPTLAGNMLTLFLLGGTAGGFCGGYIGDKLSHKKGVLWSLICCVPVMFLFLTHHAFDWVTWVLLIACGAALQSTVPSSIVWAQRILPGNAAMTSGMMLGLSFGLGGAGAALTGALADSIGLNNALLWAITPLLLAIPITLLIPYEQDSSKQNKKSRDVKV